MLLLLVLAFALMAQVANARALTSGQQREVITPRVSSTKVQSEVDRAPKEEGTGNYSLPTDDIVKRILAKPPTEKPIIVNSEFTEKSLNNSSELPPSLRNRGQSSANGVGRKDVTKSSGNDFVPRTNGESKIPANMKIANDDRAENDSKTLEYKLSHDLREAQSEENEVLSLAEMRNLKAKKKKTREQHPVGIQRPFEDEKFDFKHFFDKIPNYDYSPNHDNDEHFVGLKVESRHQAQQVAPGLTSLGITLTPNVPIMKKILALLGMEDTSFVVHHLQEAEKTVNATIFREKQIQNEDQDDDDLIIVKSVRVNVRKVP